MTWYDRIKYNVICFLIGQSNMIYIYVYVYTLWYDAICNITECSLIYEIIMKWNKMKDKTI